MTWEESRMLVWWRVWPAEGRIQVSGNFFLAPRISVIFSVLLKIECFRHSGFFRFFRLALVVLDLGTTQDRHDRRSIERSILFGFVRFRSNCSAFVSCWIAWADRVLTVWRGIGPAFRWKEMGSAQGMPRARPSIYEYKFACGRGCGLRHVQAVGQGSVGQCRASQCSSSRGMNLRPTWVSGVSER